MTVQDVHFVEYAPGLVVGTEFVIDDVLMVGDKSRTVIGLPTVRGASVRVAVEAHERDEKITVFKKKRRKGYQRTQGHRRKITVLRVLSVDYEDAEGRLGAGQQPTSAAPEQQQAAVEAEAAQ